MVPIRRLTVSNPALSPVSVANSSALFLNTGITVRSADVMMYVVSDVRPPFG